MYNYICTSSAREAVEPGDKLWGGKFSRKNKKFSRTDAATRNVPSFMP